MKYKRLILLNVFMLFFLVSCSSNEIRDRHISFKSEFSTSFTHIAQLEHIIQNFQITHIKDDLYEYACGTVASKEDATDLILQLLLAEEPSLRSIFMYYDEFYTDYYYGYIINQTWRGTQLSTRKVTCVEEDSECYFVRLYADYVDDFKTMDGHQTDSVLYAVGKNKHIIVAGYPFNAFPGDE